MHVVMVPYRRHDMVFSHFICVCARTTWYVIEANTFNEPEKSNKAKAKVNAKQNAKIL